MFPIPRDYARSRCDSGDSGVSRSLNEVETACFLVALADMPWRSFVRSTQEESCSWTSADAQEGFGEKVVTATLVRSEPITHTWGPFGLWYRTVSFPIGTRSSLKTVVLPSTPVYKRTGSRSRLGFVP